MKLYTLNATPLKGGDDEQTIIEKMTTYKGVVARVLAKYGVDGFTIYEVNGYWKGEAEKSFKIEIALDDTISATAYFVAQDLCKMYNQDSVMLTRPDNSVEFVEK